MQESTINIRYFEKFCGVSGLLMFALSICMVHDQKDQCKMEEGGSTKDHLYCIVGQDGQYACVRYCTKACL